jgi:hypothetical protein
MLKTTRAVDTAVPGRSKYVVGELSSDLTQVVETCLAGEEDDSTSLTLVEKLRGTYEAHARKTIVTRKSRVSKLMAALVANVTSDVNLSSFIYSQSQF